MITTIFRVFSDREGTAERRAAAVEKIRAYNNRFDDDRPFLRKLAELPNVLMRLRQYIFSFEFLTMFIRSTLFLRSLFLIIFYFLMPFDLIPERLFGVVGLLDDVLIGLVILMFAIAAFGMVAVIGPVIGAPLTAIILVLELTHNYEIATAAGREVAGRGDLD